MLPGEVVVLRERPPQRRPPAALHAGQADGVGGPPPRQAAQQPPESPPCGVVVVPGLQGGFRGGEGRELEHRDRAGVPRHLVCVAEVLVFWGRGSDAGRQGGRGLMEPCSRGGRKQQKREQQKRQA